MKFSLEEIYEAEEELRTIVSRHSRNKFPHGSYAGYPTDVNGVWHFPARIYLVSILDQVYSGYCCRDADNYLVLVWKNEAGLQSREIARKQVVAERYCSPYSTSLVTYNAEEIIERFNKYGHILERGDWGIKEFRDKPEEIFISYGVRDPYQDVLDRTLAEFRISKKEMGLEA